MSRAAPLPDLPTFVAALSSANIDVEKLFADEKGTIYDPSTGPELKGPPLPVLTGPEGDIIVKDVLSTGGMGQVMRRRAGAPLRLAAGLRRQRRGGVPCARGVGEAVARRAVIREIREGS